MLKTDPAVRVRGVDSWSGALRWAPNGTPQTPPTDHWLPAPTTHWPPHVVRQGPKKGAQCESVETTICQRRLLFAGGVQRAINERLARRVMFGTMAGGENPEPGRPEKNWVQCLADDLGVFQATEGSTESSPLLFGVETVFWPSAANKGGKWYPGVFGAVECFMARWHRDEAQRSRVRQAAEDARNGDTGGGRAAVPIQLSTNKLFNAETK